MNTTKKVAVLLCTYNGSKYIRQQLDSIINQTYSDWVIFVSDDGSTDNTLDILREYQAVYGCEKIMLIKGPGKGFAWNFISLLEESGPGFDYYAFSDQDDEWMENKLSRAIDFLGNKEPGLAAVHCGRTLLTDECGKTIGLSPLFSKKPSFRNALVQSIAGGNTMVLNRAARNLVINTPKWKPIVSHDWWIYILVSGCGGVVYYDATPTIKYRQHSSNIIGANLSASARFIRIKKLLVGHFREWNDKNLELLYPFKEKLTPENYVIFKSFSDNRNSCFFSRIRMISKTKLYRQTYFGNIALIAAVILNKI